MFCIEKGLSSFLFNPVFGNIGNFLGRCVTQVIVGGAALDPEVQEVLQVTLGVPICIGYRLTEACSGNLICPSDIRDINPGTVGGPLTNVEAWLEPIDDYDDPNAGEIIIKGTSVCTGYLHDDQAIK
jgi:long-chain acyl-CoA synthetase